MADTLYKYVGPERVDILESCTIRFSPASSFNDAFDVRPFFHELDSWQAASEAAYVLDHLPAQSPPDRSSRAPRFIFCWGL
jgi:hypothetical protein